MMTSPYEWKILEWDDKLQTSKQTNENIFMLQMFITCFNF